MQQRIKHFLRKYCLLLLVFFPLMINAQVLSTSVASVTDLNYLTSSGPSPSKSFVIYGSSLDGTNLTITVPSLFQISLDDVNYTYSLSVPVYGSTTSTVCYVRLSSFLGSAVLFSTNIRISGGGVMMPTVLPVSGTNTPVLNVSKTSISALDYLVLNGPSEAQTFTVSGLHLFQSSINIAASTGFEVSLDGTSYSSSVTIPNTAGGSLSEVTVYTRLKAGLAQQANSGTITVSGGGSSTSKLISLTGSSVANLNVSTTNIFALNYILDNGPSLADSFIVSGTILPVGDVYVIPTTGFEVSLTPNSGYAAYVVIANPAGGTITPTTVYVRMTTAKVTGTYSGTIDTYTGALHASAINVSGVVVPPALTAPTISSPTLITSKGFTANWTSVANASGYSVKVYKNGVLNGTYAVSDPSATSFEISNLIPSRDFTYTVTATGDNVLHANSLESSTSSIFKTLNLQSFLLYETDFTNWGELSTSSSVSYDVFNFTGAGSGFYGAGRPSVNPTAVVGPYTGYFTASSSTGEMYTKPFDFVNGGILELTIYEQGTSTRTINVQNASAVMLKEIDFAPGTNYSYMYLGYNTNKLGTSAGVDPSMLNTWYAGSGAALKGTGYAKIWYLIPNLKGIGQIYLNGINGSNTPPNVSIVDMKIYSLVETEPVVYMHNVAKNAQLSFKAAPNASAQTQTLQLGGYNLTKDVKLSLEGDGVYSFSISDSLISAADILSNKSILLSFKPSKIECVKQAKLKIECADLSEPLYYDLVGTTGVTAKILVPSDSLLFWTKLIGTSTNSIKLQAINLTADLNLSISGVDANQFSLSTNTVSKDGLLRGVNLDVTYLGGTSALTQNAMLTISSLGAVDVNIPLKGFTQTENPKMYHLDFEASPKGSAIIQTSPAGNNFAEGTKVKVTVSPEEGLRMHYWSDGKSGALTSRTVTVSNIKNGLITVYTKPILDVNPITENNLEAYTPDPASISNSSFIATWANVSGASNYTVTVYEGNSAKIVGAPMLVNTNSVQITGLAPGVSYSYKVTANTGEESTKVGPFSTLPITVSSCTK